MDITGKEREFSFLLFKQGEIQDKQPAVLERETYSNLTALLNELTDRGKSPEARAFEDFGALLFDMVLPETIQNLLLAHEGPLVFSTQELALAWELLHGDGEYLCLKHALARRLPTLRGMEKQLFGTHVHRQRGAEPAALIIANPSGDLLEAEEEAFEIQSILTSGGVDCTTLVGPRECTYQKVMASALRRKPYDIIHLACHARYLEDRETSAIQLAEGNLVMASALQKTFKGEPVVFLNSCWSAMETGSQNSRTDGHFGSQVVRTLTEAFTIGNQSGRARAIVGSMWWVAESVARGVAGRFYEQILAGEALGEALRKARQTVRDEVSDPALWSTYVLFGDPSLKFDLTAAAAGVTHPEHDQTPAVQSSEPISIPNPTANQVSSNDPQLANAETDNSDTQSPDSQQGGFLKGDLPWSDDARVAFVGAMAAMSIMEWKTFSTVHLVLGMTYIEEGLVSSALRQLDLDPQEARRTLRSQFARSKQDSKGNADDTPASPDTTDSEFSISDNLQNMLEEAQKCAAQHGAQEVDERHLLMAMLRNTESGAMLLLKYLDVDLERLAQSVYGEGQTGAASETQPGHVAETVREAVSSGERENTRASIPVREAQQPELHVESLLAANGDLNRQSFTDFGLAALEEATLLAYRSYWQDLRSPHIFLGLLTCFGSPLAVRLEQSKIVPPASLANAFLAALSNQSRLDAMLRKPKLHREFLSENALSILRQAAELARQRQARQISEDDLLRAVLEDVNGITVTMLKQVGLEPEQLLEGGNLKSTATAHDAAGVGSTQDQRISESSLALIKRKSTQGVELFVQWNARWKQFHFVGGHREPDEDYRECLIRELREELEVAPEDGVQIAELPCLSLEFLSKSVRSGTMTRYRMRVFEVSIDEHLLDELETSPSVCWVSPPEILSGRTEAGKPIADNVQRVWKKLFQN